MGYNKFVMCEMFVSASTCRFGLSRVREEPLRFSFLNSFPNFLPCTEAVFIKNEESRRGFFVFV